MCSFMRQLHLFRGEGPSRNSNGNWVGGSQPKSLKPVVFICLQGFDKGVPRDVEGCLRMSSDDMGISW